MTRILFIAYYFPPLGGPAVQRALKFVKYLPSEGYLPVVVAGPSSLNDYWAPSDGTLTSGIPPEVALHRADGPVPDSGSGIQKKIQTWLGRQSPFAKWWVSAATDLASRVADRTRLIFTTMSPFESATVAAEASLRLGIPWVADLRDPWALDDVRTYTTYFHRKLDMARMQKLLSTASLIVMNTPQAATDLKERVSGLYTKRVISIPNGFDQEDFQCALEPRTDGKFRIVHSGGMLTDKGLELRRRKFCRVFGGVESGVDFITRSPIFLLEAITRWCREVPGIADGLEVLFVGHLTGDDQAVIEQSKVRELVRYTEYLSHAESLALVRTADLLFLPMHNLPPGRRCRSIPGKTFEYMASGRPILAAVPDGDARDFLSQCGTALLCRPDDVEGMIQQLDKAYNAWRIGQPIGHMNKDFVEQFEGRKLTAKLAQAFNELL
jgi:glycosyltransferase involved in cell wall biosynthesis